MLALMSTGSMRATHSVRTRGCCAQAGRPAAPESHTFLPDNRRSTTTTGEIKSWGHWWRDEKWHLVVPCERSTQEAMFSIEQ